MSLIPDDFGGLVAYWQPARPRAFIVRYAHGVAVEALQLTPLNVLQLRKTIDAVIADGRSAGYITSEHDAQSAELPVSSPRDIDMDNARRVTGGR